MKEIFSYLAAHHISPAPKTEFNAPLFLIVYLAYVGVHTIVCMGL